MLIEIRLLARLFRIPLLRVEGIVALRDDDTQPRSMILGRCPAADHRHDAGECQRRCQSRATRPEPGRSRSHHLPHRPVGTAVIERQPAARRLFIASHPSAADLLGRSASIDLGRAL